MTARDDVEDLQLAGHLRHGVGDAGVHVAEDHVDLVALDQLAGFLHAGADVVRGILDQKLHRASQDTACLVNDFNGVFGTFDFTGGQCREDAGQRIDHADADRRFAAGRDEGWRGKRGGKQAGLQKLATAQVWAEVGRHEHYSLTCGVF